jgi:hypothetical protein
MANSNLVDLSIGLDFKFKQDYGAKTMKERTVISRTVLLMLQAFFYLLQCLVLEAFAFRQLDLLIQVVG